MNSATLHRPQKCVSERVVDALAAATDTDPLALDPPLYGAIDPEALDRLFERNSPDRVRFEYDGHAVVVDGDETVAVDGTVYEGS